MSSTMAPSKRDNPAPLFASNTPEAMAHLPPYNVFGDPRWVRRAVYRVAQEQTPLLPGRGVVWEAADVGVESSTSSGESSVRRESTVEEDV